MFGNLHCYKCIYNTEYLILHRRQEMNLKSRENGGLQVGDIKSWDDDVG